MKQRQGYYVKKTGSLNTIERVITEWQQLRICKHRWGEWSWWPGKRDLRRKVRERAKLKPNRKTPNTYIDAGDRSLSNLAAICRRYSNRVITSPSGLLMGVINLGAGDTVVTHHRHWTMMAEVSTQGLGGRKHRDDIWVILNITQQLIQFFTTALTRLSEP